MSEARVIKRYANRKLYDTKSSQYVTLDQIAQMIRAGEEVRVLDNSSKDDLTSVTLAQIIFEEEKRQKSFIPLHAMRHLIQSGGASLQELAQQAQARVLSVFRKGMAKAPGPSKRRRRWRPAASLATTPASCATSATRARPRRPPGAWARRWASASRATTRCVSSSTARSSPWKNGSAGPMSASASCSKGCRRSPPWRKRSPGSASASSSSSSTCSPSASRPSPAAAQKTTERPGRPSATALTASPQSPIKRPQAVAYGL